MHATTHVYNYNKPQLPLARPGVTWPFSSDRVRVERVYTIKTFCLDRVRIEIVSLFCLNREAWKDYISILPLARPVVIKDTKLNEMRN